MRRKFKKNHFSPRSILPGLREGEFHHLSYDDKAALLVLLARVQESAYRRGMQQGLTFASEGSGTLKQMLDDALYNRFNVHPDIAPPYHTAGAGKKLMRMSKKRIGEARLSSMDRLDMEHGHSLAELGLCITERAK